MRRQIDMLPEPPGYQLVKAQSLELFKIHEYAGGYEEYRKTQIFHNKRKISNVWADDVTLETIAGYIRNDMGIDPATGICHGARNGYEVEWFRKTLSGDTIGTDISDTADQFPHMVQWDFQQVNDDWAGKFDFVYTNSLDQAMRPHQALDAWAQQIHDDGRIFIEHTMAHSTEGSSLMDPFGAHPMCMPYLFFEWGRGKYELCDILKVNEKANKKIPAWVFVLRKAAAAG